MTHRHLCLALTSLALASGGAVGGDDVREYTLSSADYRSLSLADAKKPKVKIGFQSQTRYQFNQRDSDSTTLASPDDDLTIGFVQRRTKLKLAGDVSDSIKGRAIISIDRDGGKAKLDTMAIIWKVNESFTLTFGQFKTHVLWEENVAWSRQLLQERSATNETFNQDRSQAVEATFLGDRWRFRTSVSDGFNTGNTPFNSSSEADVALAGRFEYRFGDAGFDAYDTFSSFRGARAGWRVGGALHWQTMGETNPSSPMSADMLTATGDLQLVGDGWNAFGAFVFRSADSGTADFDDYGAVVQGGVFLSDQFEAFGRWDAVFADDDRGATGGDFHSVAAGVNYYLIPESLAARFTLALSATLDPTTGSIVSTSDGHNLLADSESAQIGVILQAQFLF